MSLFLGGAVNMQAGPKVIVPTRLLDITVRWRDPNTDRFLAKMSVVLRDAVLGNVLPEKPGSSAPHQKTWEIDSDIVKKVRLEVNIPSPDPSVSRMPILDFFQEADVLHPPLAVAPWLETTNSNRTGGSSSTTAWLTHPRLGLTQPVFRAGELFSESFFDLDVRFLNVTTYAAALNGRGFDKFIVEDHECEWTVFAHTRGVPLMWAVGVPPIVDQDEKNVNVLLFFQNELQQHLVWNDKSGAWEKTDRKLKLGYTSVEDLIYARLSAYVDQPAASLGVGRYVEAIGKIGMLRNYPQMGWDHQLAASGKPVVFVFPFPQSGAAGTDFGDAAVNTPSNAKRVLASLLNALQGESLVAANVPDATRLQRLAIGGWSSGMVRVIDWLAKDGRGIVDEAYMFDGESKISAPALKADMVNNFPIMRGWFAKKPRKLRMIGTAYTEDLYNAIAATLNSPDATSRPNNTAYWDSDPVYQQALTLPGEPIPNFDTLGSPATTRATLDSGVFFVSATPPANNKGVVTGRSLTLAAPNLAQRTIPEITHVEAASIVAFGNLVFPGKVLSQKEFDDIVKQLRESGDSEEQVRTPKLRHPWSVFGGTGGLAGGAPFKGFFQICLEESGF